MATGIKDDFLRLVLQSYTSYPGKLNTRLVMMVLY